MKIALLGFGKMGKAIAQIAETEGEEVILKIGSQNLEELTLDALSKADVAIEFSRPESAFDNISLCLQSGVPVISGTTAWLERLEEAKSLCKEHKGALLYASNFSIGVNILFHINKTLAQLMASQKTYEASMEETHHIHKLDAPSGTAISLAEDMLERLPHKNKWVSANIDEVKANELAINSKRIGEVPGTHEVMYRSEVDSISIKHEAHSREGFAKGALMAARWIIGKHGYFEMKDVLGL